jgi:phosphatidylserine decarboxylase precursor-related protein
MSARYASSFDKALARVCVNCPVCRRARRRQSGAAFWLVKQFLSPLKTESARCSENMLMGIESGERPGERVAVRQIAGLIARRIVTWAKVGDAVARGQRLGLIQFGSRCDLYLPLSAQVTVSPGDKVVGGQTVVAKRAFSEDRLDQTPAMAQSSLQV